MSDVVLRRWMSLREGDGMAQAIRASRRLSVASFVLSVAVCCGLVSGSFPPWLLVAMSLPIGWLIAERNALDVRRQQWPMLSRYIDWPRVENDLRPGTNAVDRVEE